MVEWSIGRQEQRRILSAHPEVTWSEGRDRLGNLDAAIVNHQRVKPEFWAGLAGKRVLIRPNVVDPYHPNACTNPGTLGSVLDRIAAHGPSAILIGDQPAIGLYEEMKQKGVKMSDAYGMLRYDQVVHRFQEKYGRVAMELVDFDDFPAVPMSGIDLSMRDMGVDVIVDLVMPKEHGQYYFSAAAKMPMGLVPVLLRSEYFHKDGHGPDSMVAKQFEQRMADGRLDINDFIRLSDGQWGYNLDSQRIHDVYIHVANQVDPLHADAMVKFIVSFMKAQADRGVPVLTICDGANVLRHNEHFGTLVSLDIAAVSLNPVAMDLALLYKLGYRLNDVPYLQKLAADTEIKMYGSEIRPQPERKLERGLKIRSANADGSFTYNFTTK